VVKLTRTLSILIAATTALPVMAVGAEVYPSQTQPSGATAPAQPPAIQAIADAQDPSTAVAAYAKAISSGADQVAAERVYLSRMTEFGLPEMADAQAQDLMLKDPDNGLAWAVAAHMSARRGSMAAAIGQIETAVNRAPDNPFVLRTAGGIFAWHDSRGAGVDIPDVIKAPIPEMTKRLRQQQVFATAYDNALKDYQNSAPSAPVQASATTNDAPATQPTALAPPPEVIYVSPPATSYVYDTPTYYYPAVYAPAYGYYSSPCWYPSYSPWCGPWFGFGASFVFVSNNGKDCNWNGNNWHGNGHWNGNNGNWNGNWNGSNRGFAQGGMPDSSGHTLRAQSARPSSGGFVGPMQASSSDGPAQFRSRGNGSDGGGGFVRSRGSSADSQDSGSIASRSSGGGGNASVRSAPPPPTQIRSVHSRGSSSPPVMGPNRPPSGAGASPPSVRSGGGGGGNSGAMRSSGSGGGRSFGGGSGGGRSGGGGGGRR
jgi:hypothetical protein